MAFSFTLPELRAELRALGHDGLPDHLILSFLSQLSPPFPSPSPPSASTSTSLDSSGYGSEASFCSTRSRSCGFDSPKDPKTSGGEAICLSLAGLADKRRLDRHSCKESAHLVKPNAAILPKDVRGSRPVDAVDAPDLGESPSSNETKWQATGICENGEDLRSPVPEGTHQKLGSHTLDIASESERADHLLINEQVSPDKIIKRYWISVGEKHMRALHSNGSKEESPERSHALDLQNATAVSGITESKIGYRSLKEKVEDCENELQRLTLRLQAQRCKKPWFLEAVRKPRILQSGKPDICSRNNSSQLLCQELEDMSLNSVKDHQTVLNDMPVSEKRTKQLLQKGGAKICHLDNKPVNSLTLLDHPQLHEPAKPYCQRDALLCRLTPDQSDEADPSLCSKSSCASYQHSRSSGDSRSNISQQFSARSSWRRRQSCNLQQQPRRCGKIDRVAR